MPVRRATGQSLRGYSTSMKSTEQVPDAHRGSSLVLHYVTKVWSDVPRDWPGLQPHAGGQTATSRPYAYRRPRATSQPGALGRGGPRHNPGGLLRPSAGKSWRPAIGHGRIGPHRIRKSRI